MRHREARLLRQLRQYILQYKPWSIYPMGRQSTIVRVSSKGQIVIPVAVRRRLGLKTG
jgi:hypothetical protein